tara:strand:- start:968 stop:1654 length:687 start_codon:yes stop_codon:yes gene_type:complete
MYNLYNRDAIKLLEKIENESIDLILTDPPYESLEKHRKVGTTTRLKQSLGSSNEWFPIIKNESFKDILLHLYRVLKKNSHMYIFCDNETMFIIKPIAEQIGFKFWKPIIWDKVRIGMGYHYRARYENILFFEKGKRKLNDLSIPDILEVPRINGGYPTEKPVELCEKLILQSSSHNQIIFDPFMGSGSTGVAAIKNNRKFIGNDIKKNAVKLAKNRLNLILEEDLSSE